MLQGPGAGGGNGGGGRRGGGGRPTNQEIKNRKKDAMKASARLTYSEEVRELVRRYLAGELSVWEMEEEILQITAELNNVLNS